MKNVVVLEGNKGKDGKVDLLTQLKLVYKVMGTKTSQKINNFRNIDNPSDFIEEVLIVGIIAELALLMYRA